MKQNSANSTIGEDVTNLLSCYNISQLQYLEIKDQEAIQGITSRWPLLAQSLVPPQEPDTEHTAAA